jgi:flagellar protein FlaJ
MAKKKDPGLLATISNLINGEKAAEIDRELPFGAMFFTTLAASGVSFYDSWKKLRTAHLLPGIQKDAEDVVREVDVLGHDPLTVMQDKSEETTSKTYKDFLAGFASSIRSGGSVVSFLKSKLRSILDLESAAAIRSAEKLGTLVEAYSVMLVVVLCIYILYVVMSSTSILQGVQSGITRTPTISPLIYGLVFGVMPAMSILFMIIANRARKGTMFSLKPLYKKAMIPAIPIIAVIAVFALVPQLQFLPATILFPALITAGLCIIAIPSAIAYHKIAVANMAAEEAIPSFLRDITETRKIGLSPEKSIIHATERKGYGKFTATVELIKNQLEWGVSLKRIYENIKGKIQSWPVLVHFYLLIEAIEIGGGSPEALELLAEYAEKNREIETNKRAMLKPYIILAFVWSVLIALTTTIVALTIFVLAQISVSETTNTSSIAVLELQNSLFSIGIILQTWMSGFFIGKVSEGSFAAGFKYAALFAATSYLSLILSQLMLGGLFSFSSQI